MKIVSTFHAPSSVLCSVKCRLEERDIEHLVVAKLDKVEAYSILPEGLHHECGLQIAGKICALRSLPISRSRGQRSNLVVMTSHPEPTLLVISYSSREGGNSELEVIHQQSLTERGAPRIAEFLNDVIVHESGLVAVVSCYTGKLKVVQFEHGNFKSEFDVSIYENNLLSLVFLPTPQLYTLGVLYLDADENLQLCARDIDIQDCDITPSYVLHPTGVPSKAVPTPTEVYPRLIPIPPVKNDNTEAEEEDEATLGGVVVVGGRQILFYRFLTDEAQTKQRGKQKRHENRKTSKDPDKVAGALAKEKERENRKRRPNFSVEWPYHDVTAWCAIDEKSRRFFIGDDFGRLALLSVENVHILGMIILPLGQTSAPTTLTYLTNSTIFLGSHTGNSQLLQISSTPMLDAMTPQLLLVPRGINVVSSDSLANPVSNKKKGKKRMTDDDMDVDDDEGLDITKGRVVEPTGSCITALETFKNIAPIWDAALVDTEGSGQNHIVTCSGNGSTGAIHVVRNGADFQDLASIPGMNEVTNLWSVRPSGNDTEDTHLLISTLKSTTLYRIEGQDRSTTLERVATGHVGGLKTNERTLAYSPFSMNTTTRGYQESTLAIQVTPSSVTLLEWSLALGVPEKVFSYSQIPLDNTGKSLEIVSAAANKTQAVLGFATGLVKIICIAKDEKALQDLCEYRSGIGEISALSCSPYDITKPFTAFVAVGYWSREVELLRLTQTGIHRVAKSPNLPALARSLLLYDFGSNESQSRNQHRYLLAGLTDGSVAIMQRKGDDFHDLKIVSLGHAPVNLIPSNVNKEKTVFAAGGRSVLFSLDKNRLAQSPVMLKEVHAATPLHTPTFEKSLVLATPKGLFFGRIRNISKMSIRAIPFGLDIPRSIVHQPALKAFGVVCQRTEPVRVGGFEPLRSSFRLLDDNSFNNLGQYNSPPDEDISAIATFSIPVEERQIPLFAIGSFLYKQEEDQPSEGKLQIFTAYTGTETSKGKAGLQLSPLTWTKVPGCVYALRIVEGKIVAAVNSSIMLFSVAVGNKGVSTPSYSLKKLAEWNHNYIVSSLGTFKDHVVAGDQISSISLVKIHEESIQPKAKDYGPLYPVSVEALGEENVITADDSQNIHTMRLGQSLGRVVLERDGSFYMTDIVSGFIRGKFSSVEHFPSRPPVVPNAFIPGALSVPEDPAQTRLYPELVFFTGSGRIGTIVDIQDQELAKHLTALERNLSRVLKSPGSASHARFRAPRNRKGFSDGDTGAFGFIDGDFVEEFPNLLSDPEKLDKVLKGNSAPEALALTVDELTDIIKNLQSLH